MSDKEFQSNIQHPNLIKEHRSVFYRIDRCIFLYFWSIYWV